MTIEIPTSGTITSEEYEIIKKANEIELRENTIAYPHRKHQLNEMFISSNNRAARAISYIKRTLSGIGKDKYKEYYYVMHGEIEVFLHVPQGVDAHKFVINSLINTPELKITVNRLSTHQTGIHNWGTIKPNIRQKVEECLHTKAGVEKLRKYFNLPDDMPDEELEKSKEWK